MTAVPRFLTGVILPIFSIGAIQLTSVIYRKFIKSELLLASAVFFAGFISALLLFSVNGKSAPFSILFSAILTACMYGVNIVMTCMVPPYFCKNTAIYLLCRDFLNFCTYIGSAASGAGLALFFGKKFGWSATIVFVGGNRTLGRFNLPCGDKNRGTNLKKIKHKKREN
ncbi:MAG: hypothetical protein L6V93_04830 [Clostridiales bacterium]|nr:MAG: hypothetical protein L6V93_04830 [Clostridiales bacterium]